MQGSTLRTARTTFTSWLQIRFSYV